MTLGPLPKCSMKRDCENKVRHIGEKGYVYCADHAPLRRGVERTRPMRIWEMTMLRQGNPIPKF